MEDPDDGAFFSLGVLFGREAVQEAIEMMRDTTPFKVVTAVSICF